MHEHLVAALETDAHEIAAATVALMRRTHRSMFRKYGSGSEDKCRADTVHHVEHLAAAVHTGDAEEFGEYRRWLVELLGTYGMPEADVAANLEALATVLADRYGRRARPALQMLASPRRSC